MVTATVAVGVLVGEVSAMFRAVEEVLTQDSVSPTQRSKAAVAAITVFKSSSPSRSVSGAPGKDAPGAGLHPQLPNYARATYASLREELPKGLWRFPMVHK